MVDLGKLEKVKDLRTVWKNEALDFSTWLAKEENLELLNNEIGIDIELISTEAKTGAFSTDILANESNTDKKIVIENQLEITNHDHLGKLITYASGHDAQTVIWIVKDVREEHRQAINWLNDHTDEEINIFLCKIELWKIDNSKIAPKFQIVSSPNSWTKTIKRVGTDKNITSTGLLKLEYWTALTEYINENSVILKSRKPKPNHWYNCAIGSSLAHLSLTINTQTSEIVSQLWIPNNKELFDYLHEEKKAIEEEIGFELNWDRKDNKKASSISITKKSNIINKEVWEESIKWQVETNEKFHKTFSKRIKKFK